VLEAPCYVIVPHHHHGENKAAAKIRCCHHISALMATAVCATAAMAVASVLWAVAATVVAMGNGCESDTRLIVVPKDSDNNDGGVSVVSCIPCRNQCRVADSS
jgi:hypothetical protein